MGKYQQLVIDPPWPKGKGGLRSVRPHQGRRLDYRIMSLAEIASTLDEAILPLAADTHNV